MRKNQVKLIFFLFGLTLLAAMAYGCPVITSDVSSMPEIVGDAGLLVEPGDVESLANAILNVLESDTLKKKMKESSIKRA